MPDAGGPTSGAPTSGAPTVSLLRRVIVGVIIVSFGLAAVGGIAVLLGGDFGPAAGRVLATTGIVGAFSVAVLCCVALAGRRLQVFGTVGAAVSVATAALSIFLIWWDFGASSVPQILWQLLSSGITLTAAFALASLLLLLSNRQRAVVRVGLWITLGVFAVVVVMVLYQIWFPEQIDGDVFSRALGIAGILAALGAVVVPVLSLLFRDPAAQLESPRPPPFDADAVLRNAAARVRAEASRRNITVDALVADVLGEAPVVPPDPSP